MFWKATRYICVGSIAFSTDTPALSASTARKEPISSFPVPSTIQPGPAASSDAHQASLRPLLWRGRKRRKSTCSPICATREKTTSAAEPNSSGLKAPSDRAVLTRVARPVLDREHALRADEDEGQDMQHDPEGLGPELELADEGDAVGDQRDHQQGADQIADAERHVEAHFQRQRHDHRFDREEDEGEGRVDQRGDRRADIAETGAAGEQVDVDAVLGGVIGDRQAREKDDHAHDRDGQGRVREAVVDGDRAADGFECKKGDRANSRIGDPKGRPAAGVVRRETKGVVFEGLVRDPLVILTPDPDDPLLCTHGGFPWPASGRDLFFFGPLLPDYVAPQYSRTVSSSPALPSAGNPFSVSALVSSGATVHRTCR